MNLKRMAVLTIATMMTSVLFLTGCQSATTVPPTASSSTTNTSSTSLSGKLSISGSTSVQPLAEKLAKAFMTSNKSVQVDIQGGGSSVGISDATSGLSDIGMVSRALKDTEKTALVENTICIDGIDVIVNTANSVSDLTADQITKIYTGEITNWKDIGGADEPIIVIQRESASGTRDAFQGFFKLVQTDAAGNKKELVMDKALEFNSTGAVMTAVSGKPGAIGYASMGSVDTSVKALKIGGVDATEANVKNNTYAYQRPFVMATKGQPTGLAKAFLDWIASADGQAIITSSYISVQK